MVVITGGHVLEWNQIKEKLETIKSLQLDQLVKIHNAFKNIQHDPFKWGDEIEFSLIKFDNVNKKCYLLLKAENFLITQTRNRQASPYLINVNFTMNILVI